MIMAEFLNNDVVKLQDLYKIIDQYEDPSRNKTQKHHLVRSILYSNRKSGRITRIASQTYSKVDEKF